MNIRMKLTKSNQDVCVHTSLENHNVPTPAVTFLNDATDHHQQFREFPHIHLLN